MILKENYNFNNKTINDVVDFGSMGIRKWNGIHWEKVATNNLAITGGVMSGAITAIKETQVMVVNNQIDLQKGNLFTRTITDNITFDFINPAAVGTTNSFILELTNGGSKIVTWPSGTTWDGGVLPELTANGVDVLGFYSYDGGNVWRGMLISKDTK